MYAAGLAAVLAAYPLGLVQECCDPRTGLARSREFPPTVAALVEWLDKRLNFHQTVAQYKGHVPARIEQKFSYEHRQTMFTRWYEWWHALVQQDRPKYERAIGRFEHAGDKWNDRRGAKA